MTPDSTLAKVLCLVVLAVLAIAAGYSVVMSLINYSAIGGMPTPSWNRMYARLVWGWSGWPLRSSAQGQAN
jgi:hypothetical protein